MHLILALASIIFAGVYDRSGTPVERQLATMLVEDVDARALLSFDPVYVRAMAEQRPAAGAIVRKIAVGRVVVGRRVSGGIELLVWNEDGTLKGRVFQPMGGDRLDDDSLAKVKGKLLALLKDEQAPAPTVDDEPLPELEQAYQLRSTIGFGLGVEARSFSAPAGVSGYSSSAVAMGTFSAKVEPLRWFAVRFAAEAAMGLESTVGGEDANTSLSRWDALVLFRWKRLEAGAGYGQRLFQINSKNPSRSPDGDYHYVTIDAGYRQPIGRKLVGVAQAAFEPVIGGSNPIAPVYGGARRWGIDLALALEVHPTSWLTFEGHGGWQHFSWGFPQAQGSNSASDGYLSAGVSASASY